MPKESDETIECTLQRIFFKNDTGFVIAAFMDQHNNQIKGLGNMINPQVDMNYVLIGKYEDDHKFGEQFRFHSYETVMPVDTNGVYKYLVRICKFVGTRTGNLLVNKYGDQTIPTLKNNPEKIAKEISGLTLDRAKTIQAALLENEAVEKVMIELEKLLDISGMRKDIPGKLIKKYKSNAAEVIKTNPYVLTNFPGIGFLIADRVAIHNGFARDSIERKKAAILHCLHENMQEGSIWIAKRKLLLQVKELIQVPDVEAGLSELIDDEKVVEDNQLIGLSNPVSDEWLIANILIEMGSVA